jgi:hypothetical protein
MVINLLDAAERESGALLDSLADGAVPIATFRNESSSPRGG